MNSPPSLPLEAENVGILQVRSGERIVINHLIQYRLETLVERGVIDCLIVETEDGFSQLGMARQFLADDLGLLERNLVRWALDGFSEKLERNIASLADWNRARNEVTLVAIPSEREGSHLKGLILSPYDGSDCYKKFSAPHYWRTYRDLMYNVTYEAIAHAYNRWGARRIGITHFSRSKYKGEYRYDVTTCQIEAMGHFCNEHRGMESFTFIDDYKGNEPLVLVKEFNDLPDPDVHRKISTKAIKFWGIDFIDLDWRNTHAAG